MYHRSKSKHTTNKALLRHRKAPHNRIRRPVMDQYKTDCNPISREVATKIWDICKISAEHGNAVIDLIGEENYLAIMNMQE